MANWRSNPIVGVLAVALIGAAGYFIYRQVAGPNYKGRSKPLRIHQAKIMAKEAKELLPSGGPTVIIVREGEMDEDYVKAFTEEAGTALTVTTFKVKSFDPAAMGTSGKGPDPAMMMMSPEMEGIKGMMDALKENKGAKCVVNFLGMSMGMGMMGPGGPGSGLPPEIEKFFETGGKGVILGGGGMMMMGPEQEDPMLKFVETGQVVLISNKPYVDPAKTKNVDPTSLKPEEYFQTYMMIVKKDTLKAYKDEMKKAMSPPPTTGGGGEEKPKKKGDKKGDK